MQLHYARCSAKGLQARPLKRPYPGPFAQGPAAQLLAQDSTRGRQIKAEQKAIAAMKAQLALAEQQLENAARLFQEVLSEGRDDPLIAKSSSRPAAVGSFSSAAIR